MFFVKQLRRFQKGKFIVYIIRNDYLNKNWWFFLSFMFGLRGRASDLKNKSNMMTVRHKQDLILSIFSLPFFLKLIFVCQNKYVKDITRLDDTDLKRKNVVYLFFIYEDSDFWLWIVNGYMHVYIYRGERSCLYC